MASNVNLDDVARVVAAAAPELDEVGRGIFVQTLRLLARGEPVTPSQIADAAGVPDEEAKKSLRSWPLAFWDDQDRIVRFWGMSIDRLEPTHSMEIDQTTVYGWCAWDTLFIPEILNTEAHVESADPNNGETVRLTVTPEGVKEVHPADTMVSFLRWATRGGRRATVLSLRPLLLLTRVGASVDRAASRHLPHDR